MPAALFALGTAVLFALHNVLIKKGLGTSNSTTAVFITLGINSVFLWGLAFLLTPLRHLAAPAVPPAHPPSDKGRRSWMG